MSEETQSKRRKPAPVTGLSVDYSRYVNRVLKQVHPDTGMSSEALLTFCNLVRYNIRKIMHNVNTLISGERSQKKTISSRDIQVAVQITLPGELARHAVSEGTKAVTKYNSTIQTEQETKARVTAKAKGSAKKAKGSSRSAKAGLQFPVTRTERVMTEYSAADRKSAGAAVYLTAVIEYLTAELLELAGNAAKDYKKKRITPRHIVLAVGNDEELKALYSNVVFSGGVIPHIDSRLIKKSSVKSEGGSKKVAKKSKKSKSDDGSSASSKSKKSKK